MSSGTAIGFRPGSSLRWRRAGGEPRNSASSRRVSFSKLCWRFFTPGSANGSRVGRETLRHCFPKSNRCLSFFNPIGASLFGIRGYCRARSPRHISIMTVPVGRKCRSKSPLTKRRCPRRNRIPRLPSRDEDPNDHAAVEAMQARSEAVKAEDPSGLRVQYLLPSSG